MRAVITAVVALGVLTACGGGAETASPSGPGGAASAPAPSSVSSNGASPGLPVPSGASAVTDADTTACYLGYLTIQTYWTGLVKAAKSGEPYVLDANNATGLRALLVKPSAIRPDDANVADAATALRKSARGLESDSVSPDQARAIGKDLVALRKACTGLGMDQAWFTAAQAG